LLKRINTLEVENSKSEEKMIHVEENFRKRIEDMNKAFEANMITLPGTLEPLNSNNNNNLNNTHNSWRN